MTDQAQEAYQRITKNLTFDSHGVTETVDVPHQIPASNSTSTVVDLAPAGAAAVPASEPVPAATAAPTTNGSSLKLGGANGAGINGHSGINGAGVNGHSSVNGNGFNGHSGVNGNGINGHSGVNGAGVNGHSSVNGNGINGHSGVNGAGVNGHSSVNGNGINGHSGVNGAGVNGHSNVNGTGVNGHASAKYAPGGKVKLTNYPSIANAPLPAEGNGAFNNIHLGILILFTPAVVLRLIPFVNPKWFGWFSYFVLCTIFGVPVAIGYWTIMSTYGPRINEKVALPGKPLEFYMDIKDPELRKKYHGDMKIPYQTFHDAYFAAKIEINMPLNELLEYRWDWCSMQFTWPLFEYVLFNLIPDVLMHTAKQDQTQIQDNYDRGDDFYAWFLGPQMIYTSGIISDPNQAETLEELQDNKLNLVCSKLDLQKEDRVLDIGCGWGTFATFAAVNYGCDVTGVTLAKTQTRFGNDRLKKNGIDSSQARILNLDYRDIPVQPGHYTKIISLEMAEHVGIRHYDKFLSDVYNLLDDDGVFVFQVAGLRPTWQFHDLNWGLFMNKYVFPGADASCSLGWVVSHLEKAGFEIRSVDVAGVHYSATILRWAQNWEANKDKVVAKYGDHMYRMWSFFLWSSVIVAREGGSSVFQFTLHKNLNAYHRINGVKSHGGLLPRPPISKWKSVYN